MLPYSSYQIQSSLSYIRVKNAGRYQKSRRERVVIISACQFEDDPSTLSIKATYIQLDLDYVYYNPLQYGIEKDELYKSTDFNKGF